MIPMAKKNVLLSLLLLCIISSCRVSEGWQASSFLFFDTLCELNLYCSLPLFKSSEEEVRSIFSEVEELFSPGAQDYTSPHVLSLYQKALDVYHASGGAFDISVAPLSHIWGFRGGSHRIPSSDEIQEALRRVGMERIKLKDGKLHPHPGMELDWGGIAKGFGIDLASQALIRMGVKNGFLNAGGDLYCWGKNPENKSWRIGIKHPREGGFLGVLFITQIGAATTGDYQRFFIETGVRYHHVFDPKSGYPSKGKQSVTVIGPETLMCDALSTALFVSPHPEKIMEQFPNYGAVVVDSGGKIFLLGKPYLFQPLK